MGRLVRLLCSILLPEGRGQEKVEIVIIFRKRWKRSLLFSKRWQSHCFFFRKKWKNRENLHLYLCAHVTSLHLLQIFQVEVLWQSRATRLWSLLWRWVRLLSILSHHSIFSFCLGPLTISRSSMYIFVSGLGGHWDAEHCQGAAEGADKDCGSVSVHSL